MRGHGNGLVPDSDKVMPVRLEFLDSVERAIKVPVTVGIDSAMLGHIRRVPWRIWVRVRRFFWFRWFTFITRTWHRRRLIDFIDFHR